MGVCVCVKNWTIWSSALSFELQSMTGWFRGQVARVLVAKQAEASRRT